MESEGHYRVHKSPPPVPIFNQINVIYNPKPYCPMTHFNIILPCMPSLPSGLFTSGVPTKILYAFISP
jgi:hypothetical protein